MPTLQTEQLILRDLALSEMRRNIPAAAPGSSPTICPLGQRADERFQHRPLLVGEIHEMPHPPRAAYRPVWQ